MLGFQCAMRIRALIEMNVWISLMKAATEAISRKKEIFFWNSKENSQKLFIVTMENVFANKFINITLNSLERNDIHLTIQTNFDTTHATNILYECLKDSESEVSLEIITMRVDGEDFKTSINAESITK